jgi:diguanylate cyclase (GGDEF)-like protein
MSAQVKALCVVVSLVALVTFAVTVASGRLDIVSAVGLVTTAILGLIVGLGVRTPPSETQLATLSVASLPASEPPTEKPPVSGREDDPPLLSEPLVRLAQDLVAATSLERFRRVVATHLPTLIGTRRFWIASRTRRGRQVIVPERPDGTEPEDLLDVEGREWTTFALRVEDENVGVLGIETSGGVNPRVRRLLQLVTPMLAQAMTTAQSVETLRETSLVDLLTGLATRHEGMTRLASEIKRAQRAGTSMAVLMLDLDQFKSINDRYGHAVGDAMLGAVGRTILRTLRASDIRVRWGGEEFLIVLPETDLPRAQVVASGLLREIAAATVAAPGGAVCSTVSIGITISRTGETDASAMIRRADSALYHAKAAGRACIRVVLGDRTGHSIPVPASHTPAPASAPPAATVPFPDRRNPHRPDRRRVPSLGRRSTDPRVPDAMDDASSGRDRPQVHSGAR